MVLHQNLLSFQDKVHSRTESEDLKNNETFGSSELLNLDRAEDESRRKGKISLTSHCNYRLAFLP